jgi:hypothetical protein
MNVMCATARYWIPQSALFLIKKFFWKCYFSILLHLFYLSEQNIKFRIHITSLDYKSKMEEEGCLNSSNKQQQTLISKNKLRNLEKIQTKFQNRCKNWNSIPHLTDTQLPEPMGCFGYKLV